MGLHEGVLITLIAMFVLVVYRMHRNEKLTSEFTRAIHAGLHHFNELDRQKQGCFGVDDINRILAQGPSMGITRGGLVLLKKHIQIIARRKRNDRGYVVNRADLEGLEVLFPTRQIPSTKD